MHVQVYNICMDRYIREHMYAECKHRHRLEITAFRALIDLFILNIIHTF